MRIVVSVLAAFAVAGGFAAGDGAAASVDSANGSSASPTPSLGGAALGSSCLEYAPTCYAPQAFLTAYGIEPLLARGIDGRGQTVVIPEQANAPTAKGSDIRQDLAEFDALNQLPAADLQVDSTLAPGAAPYLAGFEEVEDLEIFHAVAPEAAIVVVPIPQSDLADPASAVQAIVSYLQIAVSRGDIASISASMGEHFATPAEEAQLHAALQAAQAHHVTVVAASGDTGAASDPNFDSAPVKEVSLPASDPLVLSAGGTSLALDPATGAYSGEIAMSDSGGGFSHLFARPGYQDGVAGIPDARGVPDVAADGDSETGMEVAVVDGATEYDLYSSSGTSAAAPLWAGVIALADQYAGHRLGFVDPAVYRIGRSPAGRTAFHDITVGDNSAVVVPSLISGYRAAPGWDPVTGWGSPDAQVLVPLLAQDVRPADAG
jgi:subtilase family serine protease